jgi:hypothetical protein
MSRFLNTFNNKNYQMTNVFYEIQFLETTLY